MQESYQDNQPQIAHLDGPYWNITHTLKYYIGNGPPNLQPSGVDKVIIAAAEQADLSASVQDQSPEQ